MQNPTSEMVNGKREWSWDLTQTGNQGVLWIPTRGQDVWFDVYLSSTGTVTIYKTNTPLPVDGTVGNVVTHDALTATGSSISLGSWAWHGVAIASNVGTIIVRMRGTEY